MAVVNASCIASASVLQAPIPYSNYLFNSPISAIPISSFSFRKPIRLSTKPSIDSELYISAEPAKWRTKVSFFQSFLTKTKDSKGLKEELLETIAPLDRGAEATPEAQARVDQVARKLEAVNEIKEPLKSNLLSGKWELLYTTSKSILKAQRPKFLRPNGKIYQAINVDTLRAQNMETWPFFNQVPIKARGSGRGQLEITYLDEELRISRGNEGNLFILKMVDPSYRVPV